MIFTKKNEYDSAVDGILHIIPSLGSQPQEIKASAEEIRLRAGQPIVIRCGKYNHVLQVHITYPDIESCVAAFCRQSVHSYEKELSQGYITLKGGHRAGFCGTAVYTDGAVSFIKNISSVNIRIARCHTGCADSLSCLFFGASQPKGLLVIGKPLSGKTTILRDLCRSIGTRYRLSLIDERGEIAAVSDGEAQFDVGLLTDVFSGFLKDDGIIRAVRTMSPDYVVLDELGADFKSIECCINSGTGIIMTAHADGTEQALDNLPIRSFLASGAISHIAVLSSHKIGCIERVITTKELFKSPVQFSALSM